MDLPELSEQITKDFQDIGKSARNLIKVFICGSYLGEDKKPLIELRDELRTEEEFKIAGAFLMEDIETEKEMKFHQKFELIWIEISKGDNYPLSIIYAGETSSSSVGLNAEIQAVVTDPNKKSHAHLIRHKNVELVHHADEILNCHHVENTDEFKRVAKDIVSAKLKEIESFLMYERGRRNGKA